MMQTMWLITNNFDRNKIISLLIFGILFLLYSNFSFAKNNKILFKINDEIITSIDLMQEIRYLENINKDLKNIEKEKIYEIAKNTLIRNKVKEIEITNTIGEYNIDKKIIIKLLLKQFKINTEQELDKFLVDNLINKEFIIKKTKNEILWNELIVSKFSKKVKIDIDKIKNDLKNKSIEKEYLLSEIVFNAENNEELSKKIESINSIIKNKGFSEAALIYSISSSSERGGEIGWIRESSLSKLIIDELKITNKKETTKPIVIPGGIMLLKINDFRLVDLEIDLEKMAIKIAKKKTQEQLQRYSIIYFNKVKKNFNINEL